MALIQLVFGYLGLLIVLVSGFRGPNVCSQEQYVTYLRAVTKTKSEPYQKHSFWSGWYTDYRTVHYEEDEIAYKWDTKYNCCAGYTGSIYNCQPVCEGKCPTNGFCNAPNQCKCYEGYGGSDCHPLCPQACGKNEFCGSPGRCSCQNGYHRSSSGGNCLPICSAGCGDFSFCSAPGKCECLPSYEMLGNGTACQPICEPKCGKNSHCLQPDLCSCLEGYVADDLGDCKPSCSACPENGICISPEVCACDPGYVMRDNRCEPFCESPCGDYEQCVAPNECQCYPGYEIAGEEKKCQPKCSSGCPNGFCFSPEQCACKEGYLMGPNSTCEPQCRLKCVHGRCTQPDVCECETGYRFREDSQHVCQAVCEAGCRNGDCVAPNICICHGGYQPNDPDPTKSICQPVCQTACVNATCSAPEECTCLAGFTRSTNTTCRPHCTGGCESGDCVAPGECQCWQGFEKTEEGCRLQTTSTTEEPETTTPETPATETTTVATADMVHYSNCSVNCLCWVEFDGQGVLSTAKCAKLCADDQDKPCLNLKSCHCDLPSGQLSCKEGEGYEDEESSGEDTRYVCKMAKTNGSKSEADPIVAQGTTPSTKWMVIAGCCAGIILGVALAAVARKYYRRTTYETDDAIYQNSTI
ncbi:multiple epidermal growth factor-like domains protein 10 isoform X2 [Drosophila ficusphila]|uniref:multiple epidermal growth factor-like domains protein 10 isoform X2 n=1 Tax=Drosophila ficusphila TaxID=30025 RepID=UPI001C89A8FF|nr:multiple epidermal growth factor-like domains protein 10 isoform X2 [Drosophila ficusphila]